MWPSGSWLPARKSRGRRCEASNRSFPRTTRGSCTGCVIPAITPSVTWSSTSPSRGPPSNERLPDKRSSALACKDAEIFEGSYALNACVRRSPRPEGSADRDRAMAKHIQLRPPASVAGLPAARARQLPRSGLSATHGRYQAVAFQLARSRIPVRSTPQTVHAIRGTPMRAGPSCLGSIPRPSRLIALSSAEAVRGDGSPRSEPPSSASRVSVCGTGLPFPAPQEGLSSRGHSPGAAPDRAGRILRSRP